MIFNAVIYCLHCCDHNLDILQFPRFIIHAKLSFCKQEFGSWIMKDCEKSDFLDSYWCSVAWSLRGKRECWGKSRLLSSAGLLDWRSSTTSCNSSQQRSSKKEIRRFVIQAAGDEQLACHCSRYTVPNASRDIVIPIYRILPRQYQGWSWSVGRHATCLACTQGKVLSGIWDISMQKPSTSDSSCSRKRILT